MKSKQRMWGNKGNSFLRQQSWTTSKIGALSQTTLKQREKETRTWKGWRNFPEEAWKKASKDNLDRTWNGSKNELILKSAYHLKDSDMPVFLNRELTLENTARENGLLRLRNQMIDKRQP